MIANMSKYTFLIHHAEYTSFLEVLRNAGVLHVNEKSEGVPNDEQITNRLEEIKQIDEVVKFLETRKSGKEKPFDGEKTVDEVLAKVVQLRGNIEKTKAELALVRKKLIVLEPWGEFSWNLVEKLAGVGQYLHFYTCIKSKFDESWQQEFNMFPIDFSKANYRFVVVSDNEKRPEINAEAVILPKESICYLKQRTEELTVVLNDLNFQIDDFAPMAIAVLEKEKSRIKELLDFRTVELQASNEADSKIKLLEGWAPDDNSKALEQILDETSAVFYKEKPRSTDNVPIKLRNNKFNRLFEMIGEMYSLPNHKELDLTPFYAPFYAIFFGFCLGDAGYGLLLLTIGLFMSWRGKKEMKPTMMLVSILGLSTIVFGLIGGTLFGMNLYEMGVGPYESLNERFAAQDKTINDHLFTLSLILGGIQIMFGMMIKAANQWIQFGWKYSIGTLGWITLIVGALVVYMLADYGAIANPSILYYIVFGVSGVGILLLNNPEKNVFVNIGSGLYDVYNMVTGLMGDLLSYIRLFALGISSAILGYVFNSLAVELSPDIPVLKIVVMVLILLFGHGINLFMAALGSFVHPMRLTLVEFYKNAGFSGGGIKYRPFKARR